MHHKAGANKVRQITLFTSYSNQIVYI